MSVSRQSFLAAHWDWLVTLLGVLALVAAGALFALKMGDTESADAYAQSLNAMRPAPRRAFRSTSRSTGATPSCAGRMAFRDRKSVV